MQIVNGGLFVYEEVLSMTGSLQVKNNKYYVVLNCKDGNKKRKPKWISTGLTAEKSNERRAKQKLKELLKEYEKLEAEQEHNRQSGISFIDQIHTWLKQAKMRVDEVTFQGYELTATQHIFPYFEPLKLSLADVTPQVLQEYINFKYKSGRIDGKGGLSAQSIQIHMVIIRRTLADALQKNLIQYNPADRVTLPKKERFESDFYSVAQVHNLFMALQDDPLLPIIKVTTIYGLRRSKVLGLQWRSIDFDKGTVTIRHTVTRCTKTVAKNKTKNNSSRRTYPMLPEIRAILLAAKESEAQNKRLFGEEYIENDYVFKKDNGEPYGVDAITKRFKKLLEQHHLPVIRFHDLRHSCASVLYEMGYDLKDIKEWLGQSDIKMTGNLYAHLGFRQKQDIAMSFEANFSSALEKTLEKNR